MTKYTCAPLQLYAPLRSGQSRGPLDLFPPPEAITEKGIAPSSV